MTVLFLRDKTGGIINSSYEWYEEADERRLLAAVRPKDANRLRKTFRQLREREDRLNTWATPQQAAITWGDHWMHFWDPATDPDAGLYNDREVPVSPAATIYGRVLPLIEYVNSELFSGGRLAGLDPELFGTCLGYADDRGGALALRAAALASTPAELMAEPDMELRALMVRWGSRPVSETIEHLAGSEAKIEQGVARLWRGQARGWRYCAAYSRNYPEAELDDQHVALMQPISAAEFAAARALGWPPCTPGKLAAARAAGRPLWQVLAEIVIA